VTLTGLGDRTHLAGPSVNLTTHVADVAAMLDMEDLTEVVLVGHSYGGMVITGAAERAWRRIRRLVYLDALVPQHGQSAFDLNSAQFRERLEQDAAANGGGFAPIAGILGITDTNDLEWVSARLRPQPIGTFRQPVDAPAFAARLPRTYIYCTQFGFKDTAERCRQAGWPVLAIDSGHDAMVTHPRQLADLLLSESCKAPG
jgi:pimeloyl-ACP methyl ester carboxylesterase